MFYAKCLLWVRFNELIQNSVTSIQFNSIQTRAHAHTHTQFPLNSFFSMEIWNALCTFQINFAIQLKANLFW